MGVLHPQQIARFSVNSIDYTDFLRIVYDRPANSSLPVSRTYRFPRVQKTAELGSETPQPEVVMESSPALLEALEELRELVAARESKLGIAATMLDELRCLEEDMASHSESLKELINRITEI